MRMVAKEISTSSFKHFRITFIPSDNGVKLVFNNAFHTDDGINIYAPYSKSDAANFSKYLYQSNSLDRIKNGSISKFFKRSDHAVSFPSNSGNMLVIPRGKYVNFYDFSLKASAEEIVDFWKHVNMLMDEFNTEQFDLASHAGSEAGQTVFHFHLRFEFQDKATRARLKKKNT